MLALGGGRSSRNFQFVRRRRVYLPTPRPAGGRGSARIVNRGRIDARSALPECGS